MKLIYLYIVKIVSIVNIVNIVTMIILMVYIKHWYNFNFNSISFFSEKLLERVGDKEPEKDAMTKSLINTLKPL